MGSSGARWLGKQSVVKTPSACAVVTPPVMTVRPKMMTSQDLRTVLSPLGSRPGQAGGPPYPPSLSAFRSKVLSAIDVMALLRGRGWVLVRVRERRRKAENHEKGRTTSRG